MIVTAKTLGSKRALFADWSVAVPPRDGGGGEGLTLRELIEYVVAAEVKGFLERQEDRRLDRVLSAKQIEEGEAKGKVAPEGRGIEQKVDVDQAIGAALQAFEDGMYLVVLDGEEQRDLDAQVYVREESRITFVRLVFLAGA